MQPLVFSCWGKEQIVFPSLCVLCVCVNLIMLSVVNRVPEVKCSGMVHKGIVRPLSGPDLWIRICYWISITFKLVALYSRGPVFKSWPSGQLAILILLMGLLTFPKIYQNSFSAWFKAASFSVLPVHYLLIILSFDTTCSELQT